MSKVNLDSVVARGKRMIDDPDVKVVSFDVFDTLVVRLSYRPQDVFRLALDGIAGVDQGSILAKRLVAENELRQNGHQYPCINDIWQHVGAACRLTDIMVEALMMREIHMERMLTVARIPILELYQYAVQSGKRVIAVSDMYLPQRVLKELLWESGYTELAEIYVSCDCRCAKSDGKLFDYVLSHEAVASPHEIVHIGDNPGSDWLRARRKGMPCLCIPSPCQRFQLSSRRARHFLEKNMRSVSERCLFGHILNACEEEGGLSFKRSDLDIRKFSKVVIYPLLFRIAGFIMQNESIQNDYDRVYFISRDGWVPMKAYQMMRNYLRKGKPPVYLYGSRQFYKWHEEAEKNARISEYYRSVIQSSNDRAVVYDMGYSGSVSQIARFIAPDFKIDKVYLWEHAENQVVDKRAGSKTFLIQGLLDPSDWWFSFLEVFFSKTDEGSATDIQRDGSRFVPVCEPAVVNEKMQHDLEEIQQTALAMVSSYLPFAKEDNLLFLSDASSFQNLMVHYLWGTGRTSRKCLKHVTADDPLKQGFYKSRTVSAILRSYAWNRHRVVLLAKESLYRWIHTFSRSHD